jgi:hypothetical protein
VEQSEIRQAARSVSIRRIAMQKLTLLHLLAAGMAWPQCKATDE